jgi:hypothetical protein
MASYDVALWRWWPRVFADVVEDIEADSPLVAVLQLMEKHKIRVVAYAAARVVPRGPIHRYESIRRYVPPVREEVSYE